MKIKVTSRKINENQSKSMKIKVETLNKYHQVNQQIYININKYQQILINIIKSHQHSTCIINNQQKSTNINNYRQRTSINIQ